MKNTASAKAVRISASEAARPWSYCAPTMAKKMSVDSTAYCPPTTIGLPKSAMLSMKPTRKAFASPGFISGSVTVVKVRHAAGAQRLRRLLQARADARTTPRMIMKAIGVKANICASQHAQQAVEPARGRDAEGPFQELVDQPGAAEQQDQRRARRRTAA